ncbi:MAG: Arm DNA-binding domain-containing protein [Gammaproteobacteria bacterium]|nr:Arm DNA-binding domain-containing protein [Gammaproteobacteria bacterium]
MPKGKPLTNVFVAKIRHSGKSGNAERHSDALGYGLMLQVKPSNTKSWVQYIMVNGRRRLRGLGPYPAVTLKAAREKALLNKRSVLGGGDPFGGRRSPQCFSSAEFACCDCRADSNKCLCAQCLLPSESYK